jgi:hypothetical protein
MKLNIAKSITLLCLAFFLFPWSSAEAAIGKAKTDYPRLANYYLSWEIPNTDVDDLARWDLLILDMEVQHNSSANFKKLRTLNPDILLLAYVYSEEVTLQPDSRYGELRYELLSRFADSWWLRDASGNRVSFWPGTNVVNITDDAGVHNGQRWNEFLPKYVKENVFSNGRWDGVFYDNIWPTVSWLNSGNIDLNRDGKKDSKTEMDNKWVAGNKKLLSGTLSAIGSDNILMGNSHGFEPYQPYLNGIMLESFPAPWENGGTWAGSMKSYTNTKGFREPKIMVVNANTDNRWEMENYRKMRFSLGSVLLGDGYFSFDYGVNDHSQTWWYDEYDIELGRAAGSPINILDKSNRTWKNGVWRRDFENGIVVVNSTSENKNYVFTDEVFSRIDGRQDRLVNNGARVNMVSLQPNDAVVLLGRPKGDVGAVAAIVPSIPLPSKPQGESSVGLIRESAFQNGAFVRVFDNSGNQVRDGFFAYGDKYPAGAQIINADIDADGHDETLVNKNGTITLYKNGSVLRSFRPYEGTFKGDISIAVADLNGDATKEIITGAGRGGGPHVRVFDQNGRPLIGGFFAYDRNFRGGVNVAVIDLNGDGTKEIVTAPGKGGGPQIRVFSKDGKPLTGGFFAYDQSFRGGVSLAVGNVDGQGEMEIITGPGPGMGPQVKVFSKDGRELKSFYSYDRDLSSGIKISVSDINGDGKYEIMAGSGDY